MSKLKIKTCPFCGGNAHLTQAGFNGIIYYSMICNNANCRCGYENTEANSLSEQEAIEIWNKGENDDE